MKSCKHFPPAGDYGHYDVDLARPSVGPASPTGERESCVRRRDTGKYVKVRMPCVLQWRVGEMCGQFSPVSPLVPQLFLGGWGLRSTRSASASVPRRSAGTCATTSSSWQEPEGDKLLSVLDAFFTQ